MVFTVSSIRIFPTAEPTNNTVPTGGVIVPIPKASIMITPKWTGSTPIVCTTGRKIGVTMIIRGAISIKVPKIKRHIRTIKRMRKGDSVIPKMRLDIIKGASRRARSHPKAAADPMISMIKAVVLAELITAVLNSFRPKLR